MGALIRGFLRAPYATARNFLLRMSFVCLAAAVYGLATAHWLYLLGFGSGSLVLFTLGLIAQREAEMSGQVEREQQRRAEVWARRATWPAWKRWTFYGSLMVLFIAASLWKLLT